MATAQMSYRLQKRQLLFLLFPDNANISEKCSGHLLVCFSGVKLVLYSFISQARVVRETKGLRNHLEIRDSVNKIAQVGFGAWMPIPKDPKPFGCHSTSYLFLLAACVFMWRPWSFSPACPSKQWTCVPMVRANLPGTWGKWGQTSWLKPWRTQKSCLTHCSRRKNLHFTWRPVQQVSGNTWEMVL